MDKSTINKIISYLERAENIDDIIYKLVKNGYIQPLGKGSGREVYRIRNTDLVIKIAKNKKGLFQNLNTHEIYQNENSPYIEKFSVLRKEGEILLTKYIDKIDEDYFEQQTDLDFGIYAALIEGFIKKRYLKRSYNLDNLKDKTKQDERFEEIFGLAFELLDLDRYDAKARSEFYLDILKNEFIIETVRLIKKYNLLGEDFLVLDNFGRTDNKRLVFADFGLKINQIK